ncbi:DMT family transporter [Bacillus luteolus]|uniref:DMT family transporter n=1 Tax=Litchfieldia luteola TaxID=682179 RepID=A0ABR9QM76_9BACI|nr:DMT family transporter [Cytobacillus luteolus]MBE4909606.1 DMT family transporter [Cytobacillus luteolus]
MKWLFPILALLGGVAVAIQATINGGLGKKVGTLEGSLVSFAIGTLALLFIVIFFGKGNLTAVTTIPKWQLTGGLLGAFYVFVAVLVVPRVGVATTLTAVIVGQLVMSAVIDHFGLFGSKQIPFDCKRALALVLLVCSLFLFYKKV